MWESKKQKSAMLFFIDSSFPMYKKKYIPEAFITMKSILEYYKQKYKTQFDFNYSYSFKVIKKTEISKDYKDYETTEGMYRELVYCNTDEKLTAVEEGYKTLFNSNKNFNKIIAEYKIYLPEIEVSTRFLQKENHTFLYTLTHDRKVKIQLLKTRLSELLDFFDNMNSMGFSIKELPEDRIITASMEGRPREGELICFIPDFIKEVRKDRAFSESKEAFLKYLIFLTDELREKGHNTELLNKLKNYLSSEVYTSFSLYKRYLQDEAKNKISIRSYIDWPNVNRGIFNHKINWVVLLKDIRKFIVEELELNKVEFTSIEYQSIIFIKYESSTIENAYVKNINEKENIAIKEIIQNINFHYYKNNPAAFKPLTGKKKKENQIVDQEILKQIVAIDLNQSTKNCFTIEIC